jgi:hypothetical protein
VRGRQRARRREARRGAQGTTATASTSILAPGIASAAISTSVLAGLASPKSLLAHDVDPRAVVDVGEEHRHLDHVSEGRAARCEDGAQVREHLSRLGNDVVAADQTACPSTGTTPETKRSGPSARTASV